MFLCVSPNPAIDKRLALDSLVPGRIHRARKAEPHPGGKAAHVAMVLQALGRRPRWLGFLGGDSGRSLLSGLEGLGIDAHPVSIAEDTRLNLEVVEDDGRVTEILEPGPRISQGEQQKFESKCRSLFREAQQGLSVIFSGSLPRGVPADFYARLIVSAREFGCRTFLDTSGEALRSALAAGPFFVKPNRQEAEGLLNLTIHTVPEAARALGQLLDFGVSSAALSLGREGLLYAESAKGRIYFARALELPVTSAVGSGDSALAGFAGGLAEGRTAKDVLRLAAACAAANCVAAAPGAVSEAAVRQFERQIEVQLLPSSV